MKKLYKGCQIEIYKDKECDVTCFSVFDNGYEVTSGFTESKDTLDDNLRWLKKIVDDYKEHPEDYK